EDILGAPHEAGPVFGPAEAAPSDTGRPRDPQLPRAPGARRGVRSARFRPGGAGPGGERRVPAGRGTRGESPKRGPPAGGGRPRRAASLMASAVSGEAFPVLLYRSRRLAAALGLRIGQRPPAWVVAHSYHVAADALETGSPVWVDFHNVDSEIWRQMGDLAGGAAAAALRGQAPRVAQPARGIAETARRVSCGSQRAAHAVPAP